MVRQQPSAIDTDLYFSGLVVNVVFPVFFFNDPATTEIYTLSLHDALPTCATRFIPGAAPRSSPRSKNCWPRSEEHTSELQSRQYLVCRLLLEKKKTSGRPRFVLAKQRSPNRSITHVIADECNRDGDIHRLT